MSQIILKGITWDHSRGYTPMVATAQRFMELNKDINIIWHKRSLQDFADKPIGQLAKDFDLLIIDYPWIGYSAEQKQFLPLNNYLPSTFLNDQLQHSVGRSYESYTYHGQTWAIPMDAAAPVASYRQDLLQKKQNQVPKTFADLLGLARSGQVIVPGIAIDSLMNFYMFCCTLGEAPFQDENVVISQPAGLKALELYKSLMDLVDPLCFDLNPIKVYEYMTRSNDYSYCPFAYGYSNYARNGFAANRLHYTDLVSLEGQPLISTIGGTGLAISQQCVHKSSALAYLQYATAPQTQTNLFFEAGGQPAHAQAWKADSTNAASLQFFRQTLPTLSRSYLRPRYNGYIHFQDNAGEIIRSFLMKGGDPKQVLNQLNQLLNHGN